MQLSWIREDKSTNRRWDFREHRQNQFMAHNIKFNKIKTKKFQSDMQANKGNSRKQYGVKSRAQSRGVIHWHAKLVLLSN